MHTKHDLGGTSSHMANIRGTDLRPALIDAIALGGNEVGGDHCPLAPLLTSQSAERHIRYGPQPIYMRAAAVWNSVTPRLT